jgi:hypothetical protein
MARSIRAFWLEVSLRTEIGSFCCFFAPKWGKPDAADAERDVAAMKAKANVTAACFRRIIVCDSCDAPGAILALRTRTAKTSPLHVQIYHATVFFRQDSTRTLGALPSYKAETGHGVLPVETYNGEVFRWDMIRDDKLIVGRRIEDARLLPED